MQRRLPKAVSILPIVFIVLGIVLIAAGAVSLLRTRQPVVSQTPTVPAASAQAGFEPSYPDIPRVSLADAREAYDAGTALFVDVRGATVFADHHIQGAVSIPLDELPSRLKELDPNQWIITYCT